MKPTGIPAQLLPHEIDPNAEQRIAISRLLDRRRVLWDKSKPWVNDVLNGSAAVEQQKRIELDLLEVRYQLLALGYEDAYCRSSQAGSYC